MKNSKNIRQWIQLVGISLALILSACAKSSDNGGGGGGGSTTATTPLDNTNSAAYNQYPFTNYQIPQNGNYSNFGRNRWCGCQQGYYPIYNSVNGLGCVAIQAVRPMMNYGAYFYFGANWSMNAWRPSPNYFNSFYYTSNNQAVNWNQVPGASGYPQQQTACYGGAWQGCNLDQPGSCGGNFSCVPTNGGSRVGLCIQSNVAQQYGYR